MRLLLITTTLCLITGCGQKGPLYIATPAQLQEMEARDQRIQKKRLAKKMAEKQAAENAPAPEKTQAPR